MMARVYVDEYDKVAAIVRGDNPDEFGLFECQQRLFAWCSAALVLKRRLVKLQNEKEQLEIGREYEDGVIY